MSRKNRKQAKGIFNNIPFLKQVFPELLKEQYCKENSLPYTKPKQKEKARTPIDQKYYFS